MPHSGTLPSEVVTFELTSSERKLILDELFIHDCHLLRPILDARRSQLVRMPLDDLDGLCVYLERDLRRGCFKKHEPAIRRLLERLRKIVDDHPGKLGTSSTPPSANEQPVFPVRYSQAQRRAIADFLPDLAGRLKLDERNERVINVTIAELRLIKRLSRRAICSVDSGMKRNSLDRVIEATCEALEKYQEGSIQRIRPTERLYQFRISLADTEPEIWRRIQVRECTLDHLHEHIQMAMGWTNSHLHKFQVGDIMYGDPWLLEDPFEELDFEDSTQTRLCDLVPKNGQRFRFVYEYDFGDCWQHEILFEGCLRAEKGKRYPICLEGARACPPEDVGGVGGYSKYLEAMADPKHEEHEDSMAWRGPYDPEAFDAEKTTKKMRRGMPKPVDDSEWYV